MKLIDADKLIEKLSAGLDNPEELPVISIGTVMRMIDSEEEIHTSQPESPCYLGSPCEYQNPDVEIAKLSREGTTKDATSDTISRQAAIDAIIEDKICDDSLKIMIALGEGDKAETLNMTCDRHAKMLMSLPSAQLDQKWIPVSERLPELDEDGYSQKVLACYGNYSGCDILEYRATEGIGKWYIGDMDESPEDIGLMVLAWMSLPEKYKGEQYG